MSRAGKLNPASTGLESGALELLLAAVLRGTPRLARSLCRDRHELFDAQDGKHIDRAVAICRRCPELAACSAWAADQPELVGVVAGRYKPAHVRTEGLHDG